MHNNRDWHSLVYLLLLPALVIWQWQHAFCLPVYLLILFLTLGISVVHHNHTHKRIWRYRWLNRGTDFWITLLQGHPTFVFYPAHIANHHRYKHGSQDVARTYRFNTPGARGDSNHLLGYLLHPVQACAVLYPLFIHWLQQRYRRQRGVFWYCLAQYLAVFILWFVLALVDINNFLFLILLPQLHGLHWLLATNYLQHAHADNSGHGFNFARNFEGLVNPLLFNIGLHTAHHFHPRAHWSELKKLHLRYKHQVDPRLNEGGLVRYMLRTYLLALAHPRYRTHSLMDHSYKD
jgi:fatty acid desaturase